MNYNYWFMPIWVNNKNMVDLQFPSPTADFEKNLKMFNYKSLTVLHYFFMFSKKPPL